MSQEVQGKWVTDVMKVAVASCRDDPELTLNVLTRALARTGKILGVPKETLVDNLDAAYDAEKIEERVKQ